MRRALCLLALASLLLPGAASASGPVLRSAAASRGHILVVFSLGGLARAGELRITAAGALKLREPIAAAPTAAGIVRWRTRAVLAPGRYTVRVSGVDAGETSCFPRRAQCLAQWSNALVVTVS
jgi:hypothetical protein